MKRNQYQKDIFIGALIADALALGPHWIYNQSEIANHFGEITGFTNPDMTPYHKGKIAGQQTHYGDQAILIAQYIQEQEVFHLLEFKQKWLTWALNYKGYKDHATRDSYDILAKSDTLIGYESNELAGIGILSGLFAAEKLPTKALFLETLKLTHSDALLVKTADFIYDVLTRVMHGGITPIDAIDQFYPELNKELQALIDKGREAFDLDPDQATLQLGQSCELGSSLPSTIYFLYKYEKDFEKALIQNVYAGGDSAGRGMVLAMLLSAYHGIKVLPRKWVETLAYVQLNR